MEADERRATSVSERRTIFQGGRRPYDRPGQHPPVLVAESYEPARTPCAAYLTLLNFDVAESGRPREAVALIDAGWQPHVILADPASADAVTHRLAGWNGVVRPRLIVMSGSPDEARQRASGLILKPFRLSTMMRAIRSALRRPLGPVAPAARPFRPRSAR